MPQVDTIESPPLSREAPRDIESGHGSSEAADVPVSEIQVAQPSDQEQQ